MKKNRFAWLFASSALLALSLTANTVKADTTVDSNTDKQENTNNNQTTEKPNSDIIFNNTNNTVTTDNINDKSNASDTNTQSNNDASNSIANAGNNNSLNTDNTINTDVTATAEDDNIITSTWGTAPVTFDTTTGILNVKGGTLSQSAWDKNFDNNNLINNNLVTEIDFQQTVFVPQGCSNLFGQFKNLIKINSSNLINTSNAKNMEAMFYGCSGLTSLDISKWDTHNVTDMSRVFYGCSSLSSLDVSNWDTSNVIFMGEMFSNCSSLTSLNIKKWNVSKVEEIGYMFSGCSNLKSLDLSTWDTSTFGTMEGATNNTFENCTSLIYLNMENWNLRNVVFKSDMDEMFKNTISLKEIILGPNTVFNYTTSELPMISTESGVYTGKWIRINPETPLKIYNDSDDLIENHDGTYPGTYVWERKIGEVVTVNYIDENGKNVADSDTMTGYVGDTYKATPKKISGYILDLLKLPNNASGVYADKPQTVTYVYKKHTDPTPEPIQTGKVTAKYVDEDGNKIADDIVFTGTVGTSYSTIQSSIDGYTFKEVSGNTSGFFTSNDQVVTYVYTKDTEPSPTPDPTPEPKPDDNKPVPNPDDNKPSPTPDNNNPVVKPDNNNNVNPSDKTENNVVNNKNKLPQTGSNNNIFTILIGMIISLLTIIGSVFKKNNL